jgi:hypothetical protein
MFTVDLHLYNQNNKKNSVLTSEPHIIQIIVNCQTHKKILNRLKRLTGIPMKFLIFALLPFVCSAENINFANYQKFTIVKMRVAEAVNESSRFSKEKEITTEFSLRDEEGHSLSEYNDPEDGRFPFYLRMANIQLKEVYLPFSSPLVSCEINFQVPKFKNISSNEVFKYDGGKSNEEKKILEFSNCIEINNNIRRLYISSGNDGFWSYIFKTKNLASNKSISFYFLKGDGYKELVLTGHFYLEIPVSKTEDEFKTIRIDL